MNAFLRPLHSAIATRLPALFPKSSRLHGFAALPRPLRLFHWLAPNILQVNGTISTSYVPL